MPVRIAITKVVGSNEQMVFDVCQWNPVTGDIAHADISEMSELLDEAIKFADVRAFELNTRMLEGYEAQKYCTPSEWTKILDILEVISGRQQLDTVIRRWQSAVEETAELEQMRKEAYEAKTLKDQEVNQHYIDYANDTFGKEY